MMAVRWGADPGKHRRPMSLDLELPTSPTLLRAAVNAGEPVLVCELPLSAHFEKLAPPIDIRGWAYCAAGMDSVTVELDGRPIGDATFPIVRGDVRERLARADALFSGFKYRLERSECEPGPHELRLLGTAAGGETIERRVSFECLPMPEGDSELSSSRVQVPAEHSSPPRERLDGERYVPELHAGMMLEIEHRARYRWAAALARDRAVLDAGCGVGYGSAILAHAGASRVVGIDLSEAAIASARERAGRVARFTMGDLCQLPFSDNEFDLITCFEAIEHVIDPFAVLDELKRVLRGDGVLLVSSPNRGVYPPINPFHLRELTLAEFHAALSERFAHADVWGQQSLSASVIGQPSRMVDEADGEYRILDSTLSLTSLANPNPMFVVGAASDVPLPELPGVMMLGSGTDIAAYEQRMADLEVRAQVAEAHMGVLRTELRRAALAGEQMARSWRESGTPFWWMPRAKRGLRVVARLAWEVASAAREQPRARSNMLRGRVRQGYCAKCGHRAVFVQMQDGSADGYYCAACWSPRPHVPARS
jgi:ubiquinone/menaquinone biosynthesis C-methylase UbiE